MSQAARMANPGSINVRLGNTLARMEEAVDLGDLPRYHRLQGQCYAYVGVLMTEAEQEKWKALPGFQLGDKRNANEVMDDMIHKTLALLDYAAEARIFAKKEIQAVDADELDQDPEEA